MLGADRWRLTGQAIPLTSIHFSSVPPTTCSNTQGRNVMSFYKTLLTSIQTLYSIYFRGLSCLSVYIESHIHIISFSWVCACELNCGLYLIDYFYDTFLCCLKVILYSFFYSITLIICMIYVWELWLWLIKIISNTIASLACTIRIHYSIISIQCVPVLSFNDCRKLIKC